VSDPNDVRTKYQRFAETECKGYSELYHALALAVAADDEMVGFIAGLPVDQPNLFFASVQFLLGPGRMPRTGDELRELVRQRGDDIATLMQTRRTQTNEVGRCAVLLPALPPGPLALVEVGASAGLCLLLDHFSYEFGSARLGRASASVHLQCRVTGRAPVPAALPKIAWRRGLDLHPVDVHDNDAIRWLQACVWADHRERRHRLEAALGVARTLPRPVKPGDLVDDLPAVLAEAPADPQLVVFHSAALTYVTRERRQAFADALAEASKRRPIVWLSNEAPGVIPELTALAPARDDGRQQFLLGRTRFVDGRRQDELLGVAHPHGAELTWLA
jgi:hypothetical protein